MYKMRWLTISLLLSIIALWVFYPSLPKSYFYSSVRAIYTKYLIWQTSNWNTIETTNAIIRYGETDADTARMVAENATSAIKMVNKDLNFEPSEKTLIVIYPDSLSLARSFGWDSDAGAMGVYYGGVIRILAPHLWVMPKEGLSFSQTFSKEGPILHEYVHLVVDNKTNGNYERWFTEGIAQYYEDKLLKNINNDPVIKEPFPLSEMGNRFDYLRDQEWAYAQSYLMVNYLIEVHGKDKLELFLYNLGKGTEFSQAFAKTYNISLEDFYADFIITLEEVAIPA